MLVGPVAQVIVGFGDLSIAELNEVALAVAAEQSRRVSEDPSAPPLAVDPVLPEPVGEPPPSPPVQEAETAILTTRFGRVWHRDRRCQHLRRRQVITHAEPPPGLRLCRTCGPPSE